MVSTDCRKCKYVRSILGDCHVRCAKPDHQMRGERHGIVNGWFFYPLNFDPCWMTKECFNYEEKE